MTERINLSEKLNGHDQEKEILGNKEKVIFNNPKSLNFLRTIKKGMVAKNCSNIRVKFTSSAN